MKKFISFALAASMALSMVPATAFAASDLTASHSNIRVTANTEFYPKKVADADASLTTREVPYILLEATTDFKYDEQTFELALENAEWLERKDDGDILFVETDEYMKGDDGVKFKPAGSTTTDPGTTPTPTPGAPTVQQAETAYKKAVQSLVDAKDAYDKAMTGNAEYKQLKAAVDKAQTALEAAQKKVTDEQKKLENAQKDLEEAKGSESAVLEAKKVRGTPTYKDYLKLVTKTTGAAFTAVADENGNYAYDSSDTTNFMTTVDIPKDTDSSYGSLLKVTALLETKDASNILQYVEITNQGFTKVNSSAADIGGFLDGVTGTTGSIASIDDVVLKLGTAGVSGNDVTITTTKVAVGITDGDLKLNEAGQRKESDNENYRNMLADAIDYLEDQEGVISAAVSAVAKPNEIKTLEDIVKNAEKNIAIAQIEVTAAEKDLKAAQDKLAALGAADLDKVQADFDAAKKAREDAGIDYMLAYRNASGDTIAAGNAPTQLQNMDTVAGITAGNTALAGLAITPADWVKKFDDAVAAAKAKGIVLGSYTAAVETETLTVEVTKKSDSRIIVKTSGYRFKDGDVLSIPLFVRTTGGTASVSIDSLDSEFTSQGKTFAKTADGDTELSIEKVQNFYDDDEVKNLYLEELVAGTIEPGKYISLRVNGDFNLKAAKDGVKVTRITGDGGTDVKVYKKDGDNKYVAFEPGDEADEIYLYVEGTAKSTKATQYRIQGLKIVEDGADFGDEASITVSGGGTSKQTIKIGNYEDFGVKLTAEDKDLPVIYAGAMANSKYDNQTLKVTIEETVANSFIDNRKMEITLPEGVEFVNDSGKRGAAPDSIDDVTEDFKVYNFAGSESDVKKAMTLNDNGTKITISGKDLPDASGTNKDRKRKIEFSVHVSAEADFTGDVVMTLGGPGVADKNVSATVATVKAPIEVRTAVNELKIDYRNTEIADITLVEPEAGLWAKDDIINLEGERMSFESGAKAEVVNGDMKLDKYDGDYIDVNDGVLSVKVSSRSSKTPAEIKISGLSLYMDRSLAAGNYKLKVFGEAKNEFFMNNYDKDGDDFANVFETQKVTVMDDFVKIVTAGRDKDDATFTTKIVVPVGGDTITAGTKEIKLSEMQGGACPPAYINNDGYTMLPVRAVVEALNEIATVRWDDATKTCTIGFGQRVFSMTVGSKVLNLNGVSTALNAAPENKDGRVFLPLRDLGYALGLSDSQISWDSTTQTAQLN